MSPTRPFPCDPDTWLIGATARVIGGEFDRVELTFNRPVVAGTEYNGEIGLMRYSAGGGGLLEPPGGLAVPVTSFVCDLLFQFSAAVQYTILIPDGSGPIGTGTVAYGDEDGNPMPPQVLNVTYV